MPKIRKMLGAADSPYIISLMRLIETQSKATIGAWCAEYAYAHVLPVYEAHCPDDGRCRAALEAARAYLAGDEKLPAVKKLIAQAQTAARELADEPVAQAAARACAQAAAAVHTPTNSLALAFYGSAALAYERAGLEQPAEVYDGLAAEFCGDMERALKAVYVENEPNPAKIDWGC